MKSLIFDSPTKVIFYGSRQSSFIIENYCNDGDIEFRDRVKKNLITIKNFTITNVFRTSMVTFPIYEELFVNPSFKLEVVLEENDVIEFANEGIYASEIFINTMKFKSILFKAKSTVRLTKSAPIPIFMQEIPSIEFSSPDAFITFNPIWGAAPVTTVGPGTIRAENSITIDFENIEDITPSIYKIYARHITKNTTKYNGKFCFYNVNIPENKDCAFVKYNLGGPITYPIPNTLKLANFLIYDTYPTQAQIDAAYFAGRTISIVGADFITKISVDLSHGGPAHMFLENADIELIGSELSIQNLTLGKKVKLNFKDENLPVFNVSTLECMEPTDFFQDCRFHCHNLIIPSNNFNLIDDLDDDQVDYTYVNFKEGHQIKELVFRQNSFQIQFAGKAFRIPNQQLLKLSFVLPYQQNQEIKIRAVLPYEYKLEFFPKIIYLNESSVNYDFDESWEDNNIGVKSGRGDFFHPTKINYIHSKSSITKLLEIFDLKEYIHSDRIHSSGYCISDDPSQCGQDQQVIPNSDKVLSRIFLPDPYGDCTIKVVSPNVILDMHCFGGINVKLYSQSSNTITLLFRPNVIIPKLEIYYLTTNFRTVDEMDSIIIGTLISDTSEIQTAGMNKPIDVHNLMKILATAYFNLVSFLTPSTTRRIELVSSDDSKPISNIIVCPDHFVFEMTSQYTVIANFSMFASITYIHASQKATKITIAPTNRFGVFLPKMPDLEFLSLSTYISFSEDWFELNPVVSSKGHITTRHAYPAQVFTPRNVIPDIFIFDQEPIVSFFSDSSYCLYKSNPKSCPDSYIPFKYSSKKISMKVLESYTKQLTIFIADSTPSDMPTIDEDVASLDKLTITAKYTQFVAIHAEKVIKTLNLINTNIYVFSQTNIPVYNLSMIGSSTILSDTMNISHATLSLECYKNIQDKLRPTTDIIILDENMSTIYFRNDVIYINEIPIYYTYYDHISLTILHTVIFAPYGSNYICSKPLNIDFAGNDPSVTFDSSWETIPTANRTNANMTSDVPIKIFGVVHDGFQFSKEYINSAAKICVHGRHDSCPSGYTKLQYNNKPLVLDSSIKQMELLIMPEKVIIDGESFSLFSLKLLANSVKTIEIIKTKSVLEYIELENITLNINDMFRVNHVRAKGISKISKGFDLTSFELNYESKDILDSFNDNYINNLTLNLPLDVEGIEVFEKYYIFHEKNNEKTKFDTRKIRSIYLLVSSYYLNMSTHSDTASLIPSISMKQGIVFFDGKWINVRSESHGFLKGMTEVVIYDTFPELIYDIDPTITQTVMSQDICLFSDSMSSESCPRGARQVKYSENSVEIFALNSVWFYICDTNPVSPLRIKSRIKFSQVEMFALVTIQDVILDCQTEKLILNGINLCYTKSDNVLEMLKLVSSDIINTTSITTNQLVVCGISQTLDIIKSNKFTFLTNQIKKLIFDNENVTAVDPFENTTFKNRDFELVVTENVKVQCDDGVSKPNLPSSIELQKDSTLFIVSSSFSSVNREEKVIVKGNGNLLTEESSLPDFFDVEEQVKVKTKQTIQ
ncbi:hypothetical protein TVAG_062610 [Trichomonas vaginalis G3]|uniref:Uncharacterized protein n=1 Tax=Trichomonas vaginalis (strain ATCC PRA-98 / G3) TaxID=412133 RepID=A2DLM3_TRIV3|nr:hypothetical protein TVAGG3_0580490 [Trichomonas vaginalis G3]EAY18656.1 hypothetical protein TVAG_062610 [Trichomonas vaginalis G3]KAI5522541.1 hypothetical protein TVAGG3_0580490 [Trichomonas vaginalis G3]|eukprot:XP_001579642.1 hypothetical protein [Trichomonas vaginalis G3]